MTEDGQKQISRMSLMDQKPVPDGDPVATRGGMPVYKVNPSIPATNGLATRQKRIEVPGGKAAVRQPECKSDDLRDRLHDVMQAGGWE